MKGLKFDSVKTSLLGSHVLFQQYKGSKPVSSAWIRVDIDPDGRLIGVQNDTIPQGEMMKAATREKVVVNIDRPTAEKKALAAVKAEDRSIVSAEEVLWPVEGVPVEAWKILVRTNGPVGLWRMYLNANNGKVIEMKDMIQRPAVASSIHRQ